MSGKLYVVGTPIGNLEDFSPRAARILSEVDFIAAEDTRVSVKLLNHFGIKKELCSYFEHNRRESGQRIIARLLSGESCAIITDAGMPAVSDPGEELVRDAHKNGIEVVSVPGPSAAITALAVSGMPSARFCFEGFLPVEKQLRNERLAELKAESRTVILYEAPHKLRATLKALYKALGERPLVITRELTKIYETVTPVSLSEAVGFYETNEPRGEYVLILGGAEKAPAEEYTPSQAAALARELMDGGLSASAAAKEAAAVSGVRKGEIYKLLIEDKE